MKVARIIAHPRNGYTHWILGTNRRDMHGNGMFYVTFSSKIGYGVTWDRNRSPKQVTSIYSRSGTPFKVTLALYLQGRAEHNNRHYSFNRINSKYKKRYCAPAHCAPQNNTQRLPWISSYGLHKEKSELKKETVAP